MNRSAEEAVDAFSGIGSSLVLSFRLGPSVRYGQNRAKPVRVDGWGYGRASGCGIVSAKAMDMSCAANVW